MAICKGIVLLFPEITELKNGGKVEKDGGEKKNNSTEKAKESATVEYSTFRTRRREEEVCLEKAQKLSEMPREKAGRRSFVSKCE